MERKTFFHILKETQQSESEEFQKLKTVFYGFASDNKVTTLDALFNDQPDNPFPSLYIFCANQFHKFPSHLRSTYLSLEDFDKSHNFNFSETLGTINLDMLLLFCEYSYNLVYFANEIFNITAAERYLEQILLVMDKYDYVLEEEDSIFVFVPNRRKQGQDKTRQDKTRQGFWGYFK